MITLSKRGFNALKDKGCFAVSFSLHILFAKKLSIDDAVLQIFGDKADLEWTMEKKGELRSYHSEFLSDLFYFNGEYFEAKDPKFFSEEESGKRKTFPYDKVIKLFNSKKPNSLPSVNESLWDTTSSRHKNLSARWDWMKDKFGCSSDVEVLMRFAALFDYIFESKFLINQKDYKGFNFDWYMKKENFSKIIIGNYHEFKPFIKEE